MHTSWLSQSLHVPDQKLTLELLSESASELEVQLQISHDDRQQSTCTQQAIVQPSAASTSLELFVAPPSSVCSSTVLFEERHLGPLSKWCVLYYTFAQPKLAACQALCSRPSMGNLLTMTLVAGQAHEESGNCRKVRNQIWFQFEEADQEN